MDRFKEVINRQKNFQRSLGWPIDSVSENDRNELSEIYIFKMIEEAVELRREFPSVMNRWSKHQKAADITRVQEEFVDVLLFLINFGIVWKFSPEDLLTTIEIVQTRNFKKIKEKKMIELNADILKIPNKVSGIGSGSLSPKYVFLGQNPGKNITHGYRFWSEPEDGSSQVLLPVLEELGIEKEDCYFTNIVKCTTPDNKEPDKNLTEFYSEILTKELEILRIDNPDLQVITMGNWASSVYSGNAAIKHPAIVLYGQMDIENYREHIKKAIDYLK